MLAPSATGNGAEVPRTWAQRAKVVGPPALTTAPLAAGAARALLARGGIWPWGDQAVIDLEARDSLLGRNLLGVYDRYGWHHLGPLWLLALGLARWVGGGSPDALVLGSLLLQAAFAAAIVVVASRLHPGRLILWWAALVVVAYEWDFGPGRLGTVWAPYAIALPGALLVLLVADLAASDYPWPAAFGALLWAGGWPVHLPIALGRPGQAVSEAALVATLSGPEPWLLAVA